MKLLPPILLVGLMTGIVLSAQEPTEPVVATPSVSSESNGSVDASVEPIADEPVTDPDPNTEIDPNIEIENILSKARAYLGGDDNLLNIESLYYGGVIKDTEGNTQATLSIYLKKPFKQRIEITNEAHTDIEASDGYVGWKQRDFVVEPEDYRPGDWFVTMPADVLKKMRITAWENLNFFKNIEAVSGEIVNEGVVPFEGGEAILLSFKHTTGDAYKRYFDPETGELLATESKPGSVVKEVGLTMINGIRFPEKLHYYEDGELETVVTFTKTLVNLTVEDSFFEHPMFLTNGQPKASPPPPSAPASPAPAATPDLAPQNSPKKRSRSLG